MALQKAVHLIQEFTRANALLMLSITQNFLDNNIRLVGFLMDVLDALIVGLPTITKQQTKLVYTTRRTLFYLLYCLVPDFFLMLILS